MTEESQPYELEQWCYRCDDFVIVDTLDSAPESVVDAEDLVREHIDDGATLPCGHTFPEATAIRGESEVQTTKKKIARRKQALDQSEHSGEQQWLTREIHQLLRDLEAARNQGGDGQ